MSELKMPQVGASRSEIVANWQPENPEFWEKFGKKIAKQNLVISTIALTLSFCVWYLWATIAAQLNIGGITRSCGCYITFCIYLYASINRW